MVPTLRLCPTHSVPRCSRWPAVSMARPIPPRPAPRSAGAAHGRAGGGVRQERSSMRGIARTRLVPPPVLKGHALVPPLVLNGHALRPAPRAQALREPPLLSPAALVAGPGPAATAAPRCAARLRAEAHLCARKGQRSSGAIKGRRRRRGVKRRVIDAWRGSC
jgi:hypothetical protein